MKHHTIEEIQAKIDDLESIREAITDTMNCLERYKSLVMYPEIDYNKQDAELTAQIGRNAMTTTYI